THLFWGVQARQGVDEAEKLDLDGLFAHRQLHELVVEPGRSEDGRAAPVEAGEYVLAEGTGAGVQVSLGGGGHGGPGTVRIAGGHHRHSMDHVYRLAQSRRGAEKRPLWPCSAPLRLHK